MRVLVDFDLCESNAVCVQLAPAVFALDHDDYLEVLAESPPESEARAVESAIRSCPKMALSLVD